jgi:hypothetical protein
MEPVDTTPELPSGPSWSIITPAPEGLTAEDLGRVFDGSFQPLPGVAPIFKPKAPEAYPGFRHSIALVEDRVTLAAHARSWGLDSNAFRTRRFASYRALQLANIVAVDDMQAPRAYPPGSVYYLAKVFYGRSFEARLAGEERAFHAGLAGTFLSGKLEGGIQNFAEKNRLEFTAVGRGLRPKAGKAIYAKLPSEIEENYTTEGSALVPVEVEYRLIPGRPLPKADPISWRKQFRYRLELSQVEAHGCDKTSGCDLSIKVTPLDRDEKPRVFPGPKNTDTWDPRLLITETGNEDDLTHGFSFEIVDRNVLSSSVLGRCQVRVDPRKLKLMVESPDRRTRYTEMCGKAILRLTISADETI